MNGINFEAIALMAIGTIIASSQAEIDKQVDAVAVKLVAAVRNSQTQLDDVAAKLVASSLKRLATQIEAGLNAPAGTP